MDRRSRYVKKRRRVRHDKVLFYAGVKNDGSPRGWSFADLVVIVLWSAAVLCGLILVLNWLWDTSFNLGK